VPVAVDEWYHVRRKDLEGELYRKIVYQREGLHPGEDSTTQGLYICTPEGKLLRGWNNRDVGKMIRYLREALKDYQAPRIERRLEAIDSHFARKLEDGGLVVDVFAKITEASWPSAKDEWDEKFRASTGRDHLWIKKSEVEAILAGNMPESLVRRLARFHLIDNTRGEPPLWKSSEVKEAAVTITTDGDPSNGGNLCLEGSVKLETKKGDRGYDAKLFGIIEIDARKKQITRFDAVARGQFWGEATYTPRAPPGKFTLAVAFTLAGDGESSKVPPQGARDFKGYLED